MLPARSGPCLSVVGAPAVSCISVIEIPAVPSLTPAFQIPAVPSHVVSIRQSIPGKASSQKCTSDLWGMSLGGPSNSHGCHSRSFQHQAHKSFHFSTLSCRSPRLKSADCSLQCWSLQIRSPSLLFQTFNTYATNAIKCPLFVIPGVVSASLLGL